MIGFWGVGVVVGFMVGVGVMMSGSGSGSCWGLGVRVEVVEGRRMRFGVGGWGVVGKGA